MTGICRSAKAAPSCERRMIGVFLLRLSIAHVSPPRPSAETSASKQAFSRIVASIQPSKEVGGTTMFALTSSDSARPARYESTVQASVEGRLQRSSYGALRRICCDFQGDSGILHLRGSLPSYYLKQVAQELVGGVEGVRLVDNQIRVHGSRSNSSSRNRLSPPSVDAPSGN